MTRQGNGFVIPARWIKVGSAIVIVAAVLGPALGAGVAYIVRDTTQDNRITALENDESTDKALADIKSRLERIESLLMKRPQ